MALLSTTKPFIPELIIFEPPIASLWWFQPDDLLEVASALAKSTRSRRDCWDSKEEAFDYLRTSRAWKLCGLRALRSFVVIPIPN